MIPDTLVKWTPRVGPRLSLLPLFDSLQWNLYSGDSHGTKASVPRMEVGLGFVNNLPTNKIFFIYSASESTADIISSS